MDPEVYLQVLIASVAGAFTGALVMWNRKRSQIAGANRLRQFLVLAMGTAASACALAAFTRAFGGHPKLYGVTVVILVTGWAAVLQSVVQLPVPRSVLRVRAGEFAVLRSPGTGVRWFGTLLRKTWLRHLGGRVYLSEAGRDPRVVLQGLHDAERVHLWAFLLSSPWLLVWGLQGRWASIACGLGVHVPLNLYPVLHLRYVTWRIQECLARRGHVASHSGGERAQARPGQVRSRSRGPQPPPPSCL